MDEQGHYTTGLSGWLRRLADRLDPAGAPRCTGWSFTFEQGSGVEFHQDNRGCPLWYLGGADYLRAHTESDRVPSDPGLRPEQHHGA